jgi:hypothetical protein
MIYLVPFAVFGITFLVRYTDGPFDIFKMFRIGMGIKYKIGLSEQEEEYVSDTFTAKLVNCFWCLSTWIAMILCLLYVLWQSMSIIDWIILTFASVGIAGFMNSYVRW